MAHSLNLLGIPEIRTTTGEVVDFPVGKPMALLSYLALEDREVRRDDLSRVIWPDSSPDRARHSVRQAIWLIRRKLGEEVIQGDDPVRVPREALACDVHVFREALKAGALDEARALWRGPLLSRLGLSECRGWEHWREEQRELVRRGFFEALVDRSRVLMGEGKSEEAFPYLLEAIELSPYSLEVRVLQVETLLDLRQLAAARQALEEAKREAGDGEGAEAALGRLDERLRAVQSRTMGDTQERLGESVEFVGRTGELSDLRGVWKRGRSGRGGRSGVACILGPTGIGKTRLVGEFLGEVEEEGGVVARVKGYRGEHRIPWGTVADLVRQMMELPGARGISSGSEAVLRGVLPSLRGNGDGSGNGNGSGNGSREVQGAALSDAVLDLVEAVAFEEPLAVFLDDWQWVDKESRSLLGKVMRGARGLSCLFLLAERTGERRLGQEGAESVTAELGGRRIVLGPLSESELGELLGLLAEFTDPEGAEEVVRRIHQVTSGNPLFVGELLRKLADDGAYRWEGGRWVLAVEGVPAELDLPESVQELIRERLGRLSPTAAQVASALAGERRSVPAGVLRRRAGVDEAVFTRAIGELLDREVVGWVGPKELDFTHDQLRDAAGLFGGATAGGRWKGWVREGPRRAVASILGAMAVLTLALIGLGHLLSPTPASEELASPDYPYGKGRVLLLGDSALELIPPEREGGEWRIEATGMWIPSGNLFRLHGPYRTPEGRLRWFGEHYIGAEPPYVLELFEGGDSELYFQGPGDDGFQDLAPDGMTALILTEDTAAPSYHRNLIRFSPFDTLPLFADPTAELLGSAAWSPDGMRVLVILSAAQDGVLVLDAEGRRLRNWSSPHFRHLRPPKWCGDSRFAVLGGSGPDPDVGILLDTSTGEHTVFGSEFLAVSNPVCLGNHRGVIYTGVAEESSWVVLQDFDSGCQTRLLELSGSTDSDMRWVPDAMLPPLWGVEILGGDRSLPWSERDSLIVMGLRSDGSREDVEVSWRSSAPEVVSVSSAGRITANDIGEARITAEYAGWVRDSVRVTVTDVLELPGAVLFRERFETRELSNWVVPDSTSPKPSVVIRDGQAVLSMNGDGRYRDFIQSRESFSLHFGGTLELECRLPLSRRDRQYTRICLAEFMRGEEGDSIVDVSTGGGFCATWPIGILSKFRDDLLFIDAPQRGVRHEVDVSPFLPSNDWVHLAIQLRPDGVGRIFLNRELVFETPYVVRGHDRSRWKIDLSGAAVDTELLFRDITLWRGERY